MSEEFYKDFWNKSGWDTREPNADELARAQTILMLLQLHTPPGSTILDLGCGRGWLTHLLSEYGEGVIGADPSDISKAQELFPEHTFIKAHSSQIAVKFDTVVASEVIEHVHDKVGFLNDIYNLLFPGGHAILTTPRAELRQAFQAGQPVEEWLTETELISLASKFVVKAHLPIRIPYLDEPVYQAILLKKQ